MGRSVDQVSEIFDTSARPHPLVEEFRAIISYRELLVQFVSRSLKTRYKRSFLGIFWTMLNPLLTMIVLTLVFSNLFRFSVPDYPIYILSGLYLWGFFSHATSFAMGEMLWSGSLLSRIYVPKSVFAISAVGTSLVNLLLSLVPLFLIAAILHVPITPAILSLPLAILIVVMFSLGVGLLLSTAAVYFADMLPVYDVLLVIWMYATPIIYPIDIIPERFVWIMKLNPMYYMVTIFRQPIYAGTLPELSTWLIAAGFAVFALVTGSLIFTARSHEYAYRI